MADRVMAVAVAPEGGRRLERWHCHKPGCPRNWRTDGLGYPGKKWCDTPHRVWGSRQRKAAEGYVRTRRGYKKPEERKTA